MKGKFREGLEKVVGFGRNIGKFIKNNAKIGILLAAVGTNIVNFNNVCKGDEYQQGKLEIVNYLYNSDFIKSVHTTNHRDGATEGYDEDKDFRYYTIYNLETKIISKIHDYEHELYVDSRSTNSLTSVNLELGLASSSGRNICVPNVKNELWCSLPLAYKGYDFGSKPITYWERDADDPNMFYLVANVRKEMLQNGGIIPLADLNGTYGSEEPYLHAQIRFNDHFVHLNDDNIVDFKDFAIFANNWGRTEITDTNRADPIDLGAQADYDLDGKVDMNDLSIFSDYYLTSKTYHLEDGWILEEKD